MEIRNQNLAVVAVLVATVLTSIFATPIAPTNLAYTSYLLAVAYGASFPTALGALLPCYWIYWEVGEALLARSPNALYQRWINTYGDDRAGDHGR